MEEEKDGLTFFNIILIAIRHKWALIISFFVTTLLLLICILFGYNRLKTNYRVKFEYKYVTLENDRFYDGGSFDYRSIISLDELKKVQSENSALFGNLNVEDIYDDGISITKYSVVRNSGTQNESLSYYYELTLLSKYFSSKNQAKEFANRLINNPVEKNLELVKNSNHIRNLLEYDNSMDFETKVESLNRQFTYLNEKYRELIDTYGDLTLSDGNTIVSRANNVLNYYNAVNMKVIAAKIDVLGLVLNYNYSRSMLADLLATTDLEISYNEARIQELEASREKAYQSLKDNGITSQYIGVEAFNTEIASLNITNADLLSKKKNIELKIANDSKPEMEKVNRDFEVEIIEIYNKLNELSKEFASTEQEANTILNPVYYGLNAVLVKEGGMGFVTTVILSVVFGMFASFVCVTSLEVRLMLKNSKNDPDVSSVEKIEEQKE